MILKPTWNRMDLKQFLSVFVINLPAFLRGATMTTSSVMLGQMRKQSDNISSFNITQELRDDEYDDIYLSEGEDTWIASAWIIGHLLSSFLVGVLSDWIGRKKSVLLEIFIFFAGFSFLSFGRTFSLLMIGRFLQGLPLCSQVYMFEVLKAEKRGPFTAMYTVMSSLGFVSQLFLGAYLKWRTSVMVFMTICVPIFIGVFLLPESPEWLLKKRRHTKCMQAAEFYQLNSIRRRAQERRRSLSKYLATARNSIVNPTETIRLQMKKSGLIQQIDSRLAKKLLLIGCLYTIGGFNGFPILGFYAVTILERTGTPIPADQASYIISIVRIPSAVASYFLLGRFPRRVLFLVLCMLVSAAFFIVGAYIKLRSNPEFFPDTMETLNFTPIVMFILAYAAVGFGYLDLPQFLTAEQVPVSLRSSVIGLMITLENISTFVCLKCKTDIINMLGNPGFFFFLGTVNFLVLVVALIAFEENNPVSDAKEKAGLDEDNKNEQIINKKNVCQNQANELSNESSDDVKTATTIRLDTIAEGSGKTVNFDKEIKEDPGKTIDRDDIKDDKDCDKESNLD